MRNNISSYLFDSHIYSNVVGRSQFDRRIKGPQLLTISNDESTNFVSLKACLPKEGTFEVPASFVGYFCYELAGIQGTIFEALSTKNITFHASQINQVFGAVHNKKHLIIPIVYKDTLYYCNDFAIFDSNYTPLFLINVELTRTDIDNTSKNKIVYHINKSAIANNPSDPIEKVIMSRFVKEIIAKNSVYVSVVNRYLPVKLVIDDNINDFVRKPVAPTLENSTDEAINNFLVENVDILCQ